MKYVVFIITSLVSFPPFTHPLYFRAFTYPLYFRARSPYTTDDPTTRGPKKSVKVANGVQATGFFHADAGYKVSRRLHLVVYPHYPHYPPTPNVHCSRLSIK